jgi:hypothetical protein
MSGLGRCQEASGETKVLACSPARSSGSSPGCALASGVPDKIGSAHYDQPEQTVMQYKITTLLRWAARLIPEKAQDLEAAASRLEVDGSREALLAAKQAAGEAWKAADSAAMRETRMGGDSSTPAGGAAVAEDALKAIREALAAPG